MDTQEQSKACSLDYDMAFALARALIDTCIKSGASDLEQVKALRVLSEMLPLERDSISD